MILRQYMTRQVISTTLIVLMFLMVLMLGGRLIRYFGMAAEGRLNIGFLFSIIGYNMPTFLELILPLSFFVALMLVFGRMYVDNEMSVLFSSGQSRGRINRLMLPLILVLFLVEAGVSLWAKPYGVAQTEKIWQTQSLSSAFDMVKPQTFISSGDYHFYVGSVDKDKLELNDIYIIQQSPNNSTRDVIITAKKAQQVLTNNNAPFTRLDLYNGRRYEVDNASRQYNQTSFEQYRIGMAKPQTDEITEENITSQPTVKLLNNLNKPEAQAELGYRLSLPFLMIIACMLATPLAQVQPRQGRWLRLLPAILIFVACAVSIISLKTNISKQKLSVCSYAWFISFAMLACLWLNVQQQVLHRFRYRKATPINSLNGGV